MKDHYTTFAGYNAWANNRLYDAAAQLSDDEYRADKGAFFKSMHGTLNHLLATDRIWMKRFTGEGEAPDRLDAMLHDRLPDLRAARDAEDRRIVAWVGSLDEAIEMEAQAQAVCMQTKDFHRAYEAFAARRKPVFEGD